MTRSPSIDRELLIPRRAKGTDERDADGENPRQVWTVKTHGRDLVVHVFRTMPMRQPPEAMFFRSGGSPRRR